MGQPGDYSCTRVYPNYAKGRDLSEVKSWEVGLPVISGSESATQRPRFTPKQLNSGISQSAMSVILRGESKGYGTNSDTNALFVTNRIASD